MKLTTLTLPLHRAVEIFVIGLMVVMVLVGLAQVFNRFVLNASLSWSEEFQRYSHIWLVFLAIPIGYRRASHIGIDFIKPMLPTWLSGGLTLLADISWVLLGAMIALMTLRLMDIAQNQTTPGLGITVDKVYLGMFLGGIYLAIVAIEKLITRVWPDKAEAVK